MHATYSFLIDVPEDLLEEAHTDESCEEQLRNELMGFFDDRYAERHCDENNWYQHSCAILQNGHVIQMCPEGDYRGRDEFAKHVEKNWGEPGERFNRAMKFAVECVAMDLGLFGSNSFSLPGMEQTTPDKMIAAMSYGDLVEAIFEHLPKELARRYAAYKRLDDPNGFDMDDYTRTKMARSFELFHSATVPPFAGVGSPYDFRAFDLRWDVGGSDTDGCVILLTDIHT